MTTLKASRSVCTQKPSQFRPTQYHQVISARTKKRSQFDPRTKNKLISTLTMSTLNPSQFRSRTQNLVRFDPITEIKPISMPRLINRGNFDANKSFFDRHSKTMSTSIPYTQIKSISTTHTKTKSISMLTLENKWLPAPIYKETKFRPPTQVPSQSIPTLNTSHCRPTCNIQVNFDPYIKTK